MGLAARNGIIAARHPHTEMESTMHKPDDLSRSLVAFEPDATLVAVIEMSLSTWLVAGVVPGVDRHPLKKLDPDPEALLALLHRWRDEATKAGRPVARVAAAFEGPAATASGSPAGCAPAASRPTSSTPPASPSRASTAAPRPTAWTPSS